MDAALTPIIRRAAPGDVEQLALVHTRAWRETYAELVPPIMWGEEALGHRLSMWRALLEAPEHRETPTWVAEVVTADSPAGRIVGFARAGAPTAEPMPTDPLGADGRLAPPRALELQMLYLLAEFHGSGAGAALLQHAVGDAPAYLWVARDNPRARRFYEREGFLADGAEKIDPRFADLAEVRLVR